MAKVSEDYFDSSARKAETVLGWNRQSVQLGLDERRTGIVCVDNYQARGRHKSIEILPNLESDIRSLVEQGVTRIFSVVFSLMLYNQFFGNICLYCERLSNFHLRW
jgi:hypothetical protein